MLKTYKFDFYVATYEPGWEMYHYYSYDLAVSVKQPLCSERDCFLAVLNQEGLLPDGIDDTLTTDSLEQILLSQNIYVQFNDGE